jgi:hypothetical protein
MVDATSNVKRKAFLRSTSPLLLELPEDASSLHGYSYEVRQKDRSSGVLRFRVQKHGTIRVAQNGDKLHSHHIATSIQVHETTPHTPHTPLPPSFVHHVVPL